MPYDYFSCDGNAGKAPTDDELFPHPCDVCGKPACYSVKQNYDYVCEKANCQAIYTLTFKADCDGEEPIFEDAPIN